MGMDTETGAIRALEAADQLREHEVEISEEEFNRLRPMSPAERLAWWGRGVGKDRKAAHAGQAGKNKAKRRRAAKNARKQARR